MSRRTVSFLLFLVVSTPLCADYYTEYIWYRVHPDENRIVLSTETLRGREAVDRYIKHCKRLESEGKYHSYDYRAGAQGKSRQIIKQDQLNECAVRTELTIHYPRGNTRGGAVPAVYVKVFINEVLRVDCPLGYSHYLDLSVPRIEMHTGDRKILATVLYEVVPADTRPGSEIALHLSYPKEVIHVNSEGVLVAEERSEPSDEHDR